MSGQSFILGTTEVLNIEDTLKLAQKSGGATLIPMIDARDDALMFVNQDNMRDGYMVSVAGHGDTQATFDGTLSAEVVERYVREVFIPYRDGFESGLEQTPFFGLWYDSDGLEWYLDVSLYVKDKATAVHMARTAGELAIWDNKKREAISMVA